MSGRPRRSRVSRSRSSMLTQSLRRSATVWPDQRWSGERARTDRLPPLSDFHERPVFNSKEVVAIHSRGKMANWLGRKDSNLQPSDPESAALPLRHSPTGRAAYSNDARFGPPPGWLSTNCPQASFRRLPRSGRLAKQALAGRPRSWPFPADWRRLPREAGRRPTAIHRLVPVLDPRPRAVGLPARGHSNGERRRRSHQPLKASLEQLLRAEKIDRPTDSKHPIAEE